MDLDEEVFKLTSNLYGNLNFWRRDIQYVIEAFGNFITSVYNPYIFEKLNSRLFNVLDKQVNDFIKSTFVTYKDPFVSFKTEKKDSVCTKEEVTQLILKFAQ